MPPTDRVLPSRLARTITGERLRAYQQNSFRSGLNTVLPAGAAWAAVLVVSVALAVFLTMAEPMGGQPAPETAEWLSAVLVFGGSIALLAVLGIRGFPVRRAAIFATAAALSWALMATFLKTASETLTMLGIGGMLTSWPVYGLVVAAVTGTLLEQCALHVGPLSVSQPFLVIVNPFAGIALSVWLFDEHFTESPVKIAIAVLAFAAMAVGVIVLSRTAPRDLRPSKPDRS
jgi:hypothetical protein